MIAGSAFSGNSTGDKGGDCSAPPPLSETLKSTPAFQPCSCKALCRAPQTLSDRGEFGRHYSTLECRDRFKAHSVEFPQTYAGIANGLVFLVASAGSLLLRSADRTPAPESVEE